MKSLNRRGYLALVLVFAGALASCGGGGGGDSGGSGNPGGNNGGGGSGNLNFTANRTSLVFDYMEGGVPPTTDVVVTASGNYTGTLYLGAIATGTGLSPDLPLTITSETQGTFLVGAAGGLPVGNYSGTLRLMACSDEACNRQVGNSPLTLAYVTRVHPRLHVSTNQVTLTSQSDAGTMQDVTVTLPWQSLAFTPTVLSGSEFLTVSQPSATTLRISARAWPSGQHTGSVRVEAGSHTEVISVTYTVTPPAGGEFNLRASPDNLTLSATERTSAAPATINVLGPSWEPNLPTEISVGYSGASSSVQWLQVDPVAGGYRLTASAAEANAGTYTAYLVIRAVGNAVPSTQIEIPISFTVGAGLTQPADVDVTLDANTTLQSPVLSGSVPIGLVAGPSVNWTAQTNRNWLTLTRASGATGTSLQYVINPALLELHNTFRQQDDVATVYLTTTPFLTPRSFKVNLHQRLAHVRGIAPYYQVQGRGSRHVVRGDGFIANRDWAQHLYVMGQPAGAGRVTRVNDTELIVDVDAGDVVIEAHNELSSVATWDPIRVVSTDSSDYHALATGYHVKKLHHDALRQRLLLVRQESNDLNSLGFVNKTGVTTWTAGAPTLVPGLQDLLLAQNHNTLWLVTTGGLKFAPMDTLQISPGSADASFAPLHMPSSTDAMAMTNDSRIWFGSDNGSGVGTGVLYRDLLAANGLNVPLESNLIQPYDGPWFHVSGNGERLYISQTSVNSSAPLLALDAKDGQLFEVGNQQGAHYLPADAAINLDGSRLIGSGYIVRDLTYANIGHVNPDHQNYIAVASTMNPAGTRAYVLAYDETDLANPTPQKLPRVYLFNIATAVAPDTRMPVIGYFTVPDYPTCRSSSPPSSPCDLTSRATVSPDGNTLFFAGGQKLLVVPVPQEANLTPANKLRPSSNGALVTKPWRVNTRSN